MTSTALFRAGIVVVIGLATYLVIAVARYRVELRRRHVLASAAPAPAMLTGQGDVSAGATWVRILAFSSDDCAQCHRMQTPALRLVLAAREGAVSVLDVDAPSSPELAAQYRVLTLPTTVVLDGTGRARAINYGFANSSRLLQQVDEVLTAERVTA